MKKKKNASRCPTITGSDGYGSAPTNILTGTMADVNSVDTATRFMEVEPEESHIVEPECILKGVCLESPF